MKKILVTIFYAAIANVSFSQNEIDVLRYSYLNQSGTARFNSMGGAMGALGGDLSSITINPASIARFRKGNASGSISIPYTTSKAVYNGQEEKDGRFNMNFSNLGAVFVNNVSRNNPTSWKFVQFGMSYNRINHFQQNVDIKGNHSNSLLDLFSNQANGFSTGANDPNNIYDARPFSSALAYDAFAIESLDGGATYFPWFNSDSVSQNKVINRKGSQYDFDINIGANYDDWMYLGVAFGFPSIRFEESTSHKETPVVTDSTRDLTEYEFNQTLSTTGNGFTFKIGAIFLPIDQIRIGVAYHSPSFYNLVDKYNAQIFTEFLNGDQFDAASPEGEFGYKIHTPARYLGDISFVIGKKAIISGGYEMIDYTSSKLKAGNGDNATSYSFAIENKIIKDIYTQESHNFRGGLELRFQEKYSIRGGYKYQSSPFKSEYTKVDASRKTWSFGVGYREETFYADATLSNTKTHEEYYLYDPSYVDLTDIKSSIVNVTFTVGTRF